MFKSIVQSFALISGLGVWHFWCEYRRDNWAEVCSFPLFVVDHRGIMNIVHGR